MVYIQGKSREFNFKIAQVIPINVTNPINFLKYPPMTTDHCQRILDDITFCCHLAVKTTFLYSVHPGLKYASMQACNMNSMGSSI